MDKFNFNLQMLPAIIIGICWFIFILAIIYRLSVPKPEPYIIVKRNRTSDFGLVLQLISIGFALLTFRRGSQWYVISDNPTMNLILGSFASLLALASTAFAVSAISTLGKNWSLKARILESQELITNGAFQLVRHPIYTAMLGLLVATGIVFSRWYTTLIAICLFLIATKIRMIAEEKLLNEKFPEQYKAYASKTPSLIPFLKI